MHVKIFSSDFEWSNPSDAEAGIFQEDFVNEMVADIKAPWEVIT